MATKKILLLMMLCASWARGAGVAGQPGAFARVGVGARAAALGNAFGALAEGPTAVYWQPAALSSQRGLGLSSMVSALSLGRRFNYVGLAWGPSATTRWGGIGVGWLNFSLGDDFEGRVSDSAGYYSFSDQQNLYLVAWGLPLTTWMDLGLTGRIYQRQLERFSATGAGGDVGLLLRPLSRLKISAHASDLGSVLTWSTGYEEKFPWTLRSGAALALWRDRINLTGQISQTQARDAEAMAGLELWPVSLLALRAGIDARGISVGGGVSLKVKTFQLGLDYSLAEDPIKEGNVQKISIELLF